MWDLERLGQTPQVWPAEGFDEPGVKAILYEGEPYEGRPTKVFAWLGLPEVPAGQTVPGMVLIHGGGGTAFADWVRMWTARGYAAISMDTCGCFPGGEHSNRPRNPDGGAPGWGGWNQIDWPRTDQWTYQAIAACIRANSLLRAQPGVDPERIGVTGISWGGYLTALLAGVDSGSSSPRRSTAADSTRARTSLRRSTTSTPPSAPGGCAGGIRRPTCPTRRCRCCGSPAATTSRSGSPVCRPAIAPHRARTPWRSGCACPRPEPGRRTAEIPVFADHLFRGGPGLPRITGQGRDGQRVWCTFESPVPVVKAELNVTRDTNPNWPDRTWEALPATLTNSRVEADLPAGVAVYYLNLTDDRDCVVSTEHEALLK